MFGLFEIFLVAAGASAVIVFFSLLYVFGREASAQERALGVSILVAAAASYMGIYWFETSHGTTRGNAIAVSVAYGSIVFLVLFGVGYWLKEWPSRAAFNKAFREDFRWRKRNPRAAAAYDEEVSRQFREDTYDEEPSQLIRDRLRRTFDEPPG